MHAFIHYIKNPIISLEISAKTLCFTGGETFPFPEGTFGDAEKMAAAGSAYINKNYIPHRLTARLCVSTRQTVIRTVPADCPFDASTYVMDSDIETDFFAALPVKTVESLIEMCCLWGIKPHNIESLTLLEHTLIKKYTADTAGIFLPQENGLRLLLTNSGKLTHAYYISDEPVYLKIALDRILDLPSHLLYAPDSTCPELEKYLNGRKIRLCQV